MMANYESAISETPIPFQERHSDSWKLVLPASWIFRPETSTYSDGWLVDNPKTVIAEARIDDGQLAFIV